MNKIQETKVIYRSVFDCKNGDAVIEDLCNRFNISTTTYNDDIKPETMIYKEGARSVVLYLMNQLKEKKKLNKE